MLDTSDAIFNEELLKKEFCRSSKSSKVQGNQMNVEIDSTVRDGRSARSVALWC